MGIHTVKRIWRDMTFRKERYLVGPLASSHTPHKKNTSLCIPTPQRPDVSLHPKYEGRRGGIALCLTLNAYQKEGRGKGAPATCSSGPAGPGPRSLRCDRQGVAALPFLLTWLLDWANTLHDPEGVQLGGAPNVARICGITGVACGTERKGGRTTGQARAPFHGTVASW